MIRCGKHVSEISLRNVPDPDHTGCIFAFDSEYIIVCFRNCDGEHTGYQTVPFIGFAAVSAADFKDYFSSFMFNFQL